MVLLSMLERERKREQILFLQKKGGIINVLSGILLTPLTMRVPILVTNPLTLSDLRDDRASVEPGSSGASKATHS